MARTSRSSSSERLRYRYGICLNEGCEKCKSKEVQQIPARKDLVCEACGKPLRECPPPPPPRRGIIAVIVLAVIVVAGLVWWLWFMPSGQSSGEAKTAGRETVEVEVDTTKVKNPVTEITDTVTGGQSEKPAVEKEKEKQGEQTTAPQVMNGHGTVTLPYGTYTGDLKNGKPHGYGKLTYRKTHKITGSKDYVAEPGDTYEGEFRNGVPSGGRGYLNHKGDVNTIKL